MASSSSTRRKATVQRTRMHRFVEDLNIKASSRDPWDPNQVIHVDPAIAPFLIDDTATKAYGQLGRLPIIYERKVDPDVRERYHLDRSFTAIGCASLLEGSQVIYPSLMKQFYANLFYAHGKSFIESTVKGVSIKIDKALLGEILDVCSEGISLDLYMSEVNLGKVEKKVFLGSPPSSTGIEYSGANLKERPRIINRFAHANIYPKNSHFSNVRKDVLRFLYCIETGTRGDVASLMLMRFMEPTSFTLFFPGWLSKVFEHFDVDLSNELAVPNPHSFTMEHVHKILREKAKGKREETSESAPSHQKGVAVDEMMGKLNLMDAKLNYIVDVQTSSLQTIGENVHNITNHLGLPYIPYTYPSYNQYMTDWTQQQQGGQPEAEESSNSLNDISWEEEEEVQTRKRRSRR